MISDKILFFNIVANFKEQPFNFNYTVYRKLSYANISNLEEKWKTIDLVIEKLFTRITSGPVWKIFKYLFTLFVRDFSFKLKKILSRVLTTKFNPIMSSLQFLLMHWPTDTTRRQTDAVPSQAIFDFSVAMRNVRRIGENAKKETFS